MPPLKRIAPSSLRLRLDDCIGEGRCALILDPAANAREALAERLALAGFDCVAAAGLADARRHLESRTIALLVAEPGCDPGFAAAHERWQARWPELATLLCCAREPAAPSLLVLPRVVKPASEGLWWSALAAALPERCSA